MPALIKPLPRPDAVRPKLAAFTLPPAAVAGRGTFAVRSFVRQQGFERKPGRLKGNCPV